ncbi:MAG: right-handed parallel beta-helix repeat-containing protein [Planctomycetota bacterium]
MNLFRILMALLLSLATVIAAEDEPLSAEIVELSPEKLNPSSVKKMAPVGKPQAVPLKVAADDVRAEIVILPALKSPPVKSTLAKIGKEFAVTPKSDVILRESGFATVLSGRLDRDRELGPADSPILIRGNFVIPVGVTFKLKAGAVVALQGDAKAEKSIQPETPDPTQSAVIWVWGAFVVEGVTGNPVEITGQKENTLLLYSSTQNTFEGARLKNVTIVQNGGSSFWTNCEIFNARHYALAAGIGIFTHCSFRNCGGLFATYDVGPWSLILRKNIFDHCREGVILGNNPGEARLVIEKNHFLRTRGAHVRVAPPSGAAAAKDGKAKDREEEFLIGENWYGAALPEEVDMRIVDRRSDPALKARLNIRQPAEQPYGDAGAGISAATLAATLREQQPLQQKLWRTHPMLPDLSISKKQPTTMNPPPVTRKSEHY